jgi:hypothetical protein
LEVAKMIGGKLTPTKRKKIAKKILTNMKKSKIEIKKSKKVRKAKELKKNHRSKSAARKNLNSSIGNNKN